MKLEADKPLVRVALFHEATIRCCYSWNKSPHVTWIMNIHTTNGTTMLSLVNLSNNLMNKTTELTGGVTCHLLFFKRLRLNDTGLYLLYSESDHSYIKSVKNSVITAEGVLLLMCVLIPGTMPLCKVRHTDRVIETGIFILLYCALITL
uniref:Uncharacterized protein n=1 Tax=Sinocyclocheilus grahami TaxID=75366 RepID=A0A672QYZ1_SINGR